MIQAVSLFKQYAGKKVLHDLSLKVDRGCVLGFIGPNGAGKTTTMRIICGIMPPSDGQVSISGIDMIQDPVHAKSRLGYLPENAPLPPGMTVDAFLHYCGRMRGLSGRGLEMQVDKASDRCCLKAVRFEDVEALSKGFRRRTCLAQSLIHEPENLVLDEPTDGLDPDQKREIRALIRELREHTAIIVSTHILEEIGEVCDRVLAIRSGRKVFEGTTGEFQNLLPEAGGIELEIGQYPDALLKKYQSFSGNLTVSPEKDRMKIRITGGKNQPEELFIQAVNAAAESGIKLLSGRAFRATPAEIFSALHDRSKEGNR